jgi:heme O synthase-like polyprenyltransferase
MPAFSFSIVYLFGLFAALMFDHYASGPFMSLWQGVS